MVCDHLLHQTVTSDDLFPILRGLTSICGVQPQPTSPRGRKTTYSHTAMPCSWCPERCGLEFMLRIHLLSLGTEHSHKETQLGESERNFIRSWVCGSPCNPTGQSKTDGEAGSKTNSISTPWGPQPGGSRHLKTLPHTLPGLRGPCKK